MKKEKSEWKYCGSSAFLGAIIGGMFMFLISTAMYVGRLQTYFDNPPLTRDSCIKYVTNNLK